MLQLHNITKGYKVGQHQIVSALRGINLKFERSGFISILGPSGCGKTTLLNIIGGLNGADGGDLIIDGISTKNYHDRNWDAYRNYAVGFVFQSYNLIPHLSVQENVALSLSLRGIGKTERMNRSAEALISVGLSDQLKKRPNQMSNGQMQRVAIARALVGDPKIILADEPTGALDYETSRQVMDLLKEVSKTRLVVMVSHNRELADEYSNRIITLKDGQVVSDTYADPIVIANKAKQYREENAYDSLMTLSRYTDKKVSMRFLTALRLSFKNLLTKKVRTILTSIAGSVGIVGLGLVIAITLATGAQLRETEANFLAGTPLTIHDTTSEMIPGTGNFTPPAQGEFPDTNTLYTFDRLDSLPEFHVNYFSEAFMAHLDLIDPTLITNKNFARGMALTAIARRDNGTYARLPRGQNTLAGGRIWGTFVELPQSAEFAQHHNPVIFGRYPAAYNEAVLFVDRFNRIEQETLNSLGFENRSHTFEELINRSFQVIHNDDLFVSVGTPEAPHFGQLGSNHANNHFLYNRPNSTQVRIVGIMRERRGITPILPSMGIGFTPRLMQKMMDSAENSSVTTTQAANPDRDILAGSPWLHSNFSNNMFFLGGTSAPRSIQIFYARFEAVDIISDHITAFNIGRPDEERIFFQNPAAPQIELIEEALNVISVIFMIMIGVSLTVSTIMIGIITYISVMERIKEIGLLRALGARKKDVSRIFNAETIIIGFIAGILGTIFTYILSNPINLLIYELVEVETSASLPLPFALLLIASSILLTFIAGFIPAKIASRKDPVKALRSE